jgi:transposase
MRLIEQEKDIEVLRAYTKWLIEKNLLLQKTLNETLNEQARAAQKQFKIEEQLLVLRKNLFGKKSEKRPESEDRVRGDDELEVLIHSRSLVPAIKPRQIKSLPEEIIYYGLTDEELKEESKLREATGPWLEMPGFYDESVEVTTIERSFKKLIHRRKKYGLTEPGDKKVIITAPGPEKLLPGATYSIDFAVGVVSDKYVNHMPLERQTRQMESLGLKDMNTKTLYGLCQASALHLEAVAEKIKKEVLGSGLCAHCDETPWPIQIKEQDDGYMWVTSNQAGSHYRFEPTRSGLIVKETLKGYSGPVMCDGYSGYNRLKEIGNIQISNCWAHARRKFFEIQENYPLKTTEILDLIDSLFKVERKAKDLDHLKSLRETESKIIISKIQAWLIENKQKERSETGLIKAIDYTLKFWPGLTLFLENNLIPLSNNDAERTIRHAVMGRKNFYGSRTHNGADVAATLYTVIESCKKVEIDPRTFINMAVRKSVRQEEPITPGV